MEIHKVAVIGAGTMGSGIAQVAATAGCSVQLFDASPEAITRSQKNLLATLAKLVEKAKISPDESARIAANISYVSQITELSNAQLIIEAIVENSEIKRALFAQLETIVAPDSLAQPPAGAGHRVALHDGQSPVQLHQLERDQGTRHLRRQYRRTRDTKSCSPLEGRTSSLAKGQLLWTFSY